MASYPCPASQPVQVFRTIGVRPLPTRQQFHSSDRAALPGPDQFGSGPGIASQEDVAPTVMNPQRAFSIGSGVSICGR
jgi:hypothetical protein